MELSFRSGPPQLSSKLCRIRRSTLLHWQDGGEGKKTSGKKSLKRDSLFSKLCVHKQCSQCSSSCVETLVTLRAKFHVVSSLLSVLNIAILSTQRSHWKWFCPEQWKYGHLKCAAFIVIMLLNESLTWVHSQKDPRLYFGASFALRVVSDVGIQSAVDCIPVVEVCYHVTRYCPKEILYFWMPHAYLKIVL